MIPEIENSIVERLGVLADMGVDISLTPEVEIDYSHPVKKPRVTVTMFGIKTDGRRIQNSNATDVEVEIKVTIQSRKLRGDLGIIPIFEAIATRLYGFRPAGTSKMYFISFEFENFEKGLWTAFAMFYAPAVMIEKADEEFETYLHQLKLTINGSESIIE